MAKKVDTSGFDAEFVINQAKPGNRQKELSAYDPSTSDSDSADEPKNTTKEPQEPVPPPVAESETVNEKEVPREESKRRENKTQEYESLFFKQSAIKTRNGKVVYIRKEHHDRIMKIVRVIGENEFSLFNYLDNILEHHFATNQDEITKLYRKKNTDVF